MFSTDSSYWVQALHLYIYALLVFVGYCLNQYCISSNSGKMPVWIPNFLPHQYRMRKLSSLKDRPDYIILTRETRYKHLADLFPIPFIGIASIGDVLIITGSLLIGISVIRILTPVVVYFLQIIH
jgi:hypothetical protein